MSNPARQTALTALRRFLGAVPISLMALACVLMLAAVVLVAERAVADPLSSGAPSNAGYGRSLGAENHGVNPGSTSLRAGRTVINGRILLGEASSTLSGSLGTSIETSQYGGGFAVGNQLNVIVQGDWNIVVIDSTQINNGDVTAGVSTEQDENNDDQ